MRTMDAVRSRRLPGPLVGALAGSLLAAATVTAQGAGPVSALASPTSAARSTATAREGAAPTRSPEPILPSPAALALASGTPTVAAGAPALPRAAASTPSGPSPVTPASPPRQAVPVSVDGISQAFTPGRSYDGYFADPDVAALTVGDATTLYATSTNAAGLHLPLMKSTDLAHWYPLTSGRPDPDPFPRVAAWVSPARQDADGGQGLWAPAIAKMGSGSAAGWVVAYAAQASVLDGQRHNCIGLARAASPTGPFIETSSMPLECAADSPQGAIDPDLFTDTDPATGVVRNWLLWKFSGVPGHAPAQVMVRQLNADGTDWAPGSTATSLLSNDFGDAWEGETIENPSMITYRALDGTGSVRPVTYLFYSVNDYRTSAYATGYAICQSVTGPCVKQGPLLTTANTGRLGPGGASAVVFDGGLYLAYAAWDAPVAAPAKKSSKPSSRPGKKPGIKKRRLDAAASPRDGSASGSRSPTTASSPQSSPAPVGTTRRLYIAAIHQNPDGSLGFVG